MGVSGQRHTPDVLYPRETIPGIPRIGGWVDLKASLDTEARKNLLSLLGI
jgi:hypothetical protein